jgi:hypothetical protein
MPLSFGWRNRVMLNAVSVLPMRKQPNGRNAKNMRARLFSAIFLRRMCLTYAGRAAVLVCRNVSAGLKRPSGLRLLATTVKFPDVWKVPVIR